MDTAATYRLKRYHVERKRIIEFAGQLWTRQLCANHNSNKSEAVDWILQGLILPRKTKYFGKQTIKSMLNTEIKERRGTLTAAAEKFIPKSVMIMIARYIDWE